MILKRTQLPELQQDILQALLNQGSLRRAKGGYVSAPGAKPFTVRSVRMVARAGLVFFSADQAHVAITSEGSRLMLEGQVELKEQMAA